MSDRNRLIALGAVLVLRAFSAAAESLADWLEGQLGGPPPEDDPEGP